MGAFLAALAALNENAATMMVDDIDAALDELRNLLHNIIPPEAA